MNKKILKWLNEDCNRAINLKAIDKTGLYGVQIHYCTYSEKKKNTWSNWYTGQSIVQAFELALECESPE